MKTIWKFPLPTTSVQQLHMPRGFETLCVQVQQGVPHLWALVDDDADLVEVRVETTGTGWPMDGNQCTKYVGTYQEHNGALVWHVFLPELNR
jgi:hypothetical protein